jgi:hypothetical protein
MQPLTGPHSDYASISHPYDHVQLYSLFMSGLVLAFQRTPIVKHSYLESTRLWWHSGEGFNTYNIATLLLSTNSTQPHFFCRVLP